MLAKIIGSAIVVMATSKIGYDTANKYGRRVKEIRAFQSGLWGLQSEISFCQTMLDTALLKASSLIPTNAAKVFSKASENLRSINGITAKDAWCKALMENEKDLSLGADDISILYAFGGLLGTNDVVGEISNIELAIEKLKICEKAAVDDEKKYSKLYKSLGIIGGIFLSIIFI